MIGSSPEDRRVHNPDDNQHRRGQGSCAGEKKPLVVHAKKLARSGFSVNTHLGALADLLLSAGGHNSSIPPGKSGVA